MTEEVPQDPPKIEDSKQIEDEQKSELPNKADEDEKNESEKNENSPSKRPLTVTFNVPENYTPSKNQSMRVSFNESRSSPSRPKTTSKGYASIKTADLSHISDHKTTNPGKSFIPPEFIREVMTPTPLRPETGTLNVDKKTWHTTVFPSENANSREEVQNLGKWLNQMLTENQKTSTDPFELAKNARHWFTIAYDELCREVSVDCPERAKLLASIWKRYQALFQRVIQLHQEEKDYLINCHKERTTALKSELEASQAKLKQISQQYRDDQERWSNSREKEETKFANMRKKLDLQVKNKRSLLIQINQLKERLENSSTEQKENENSDTKNVEPEKTEVETEEASKKEDITPQQISDRVHQLRQQMRKKIPSMYDVLATLDDIAHLVDQERKPSKNTRDLFPAFFEKALSPSYAGKIRTIEWTMSCLSHIYSLRLTLLSEQNLPYDYGRERTHFLDFIYEHFLLIFGLPQMATETLFDLIETVRGLSNSGNTRCRTFLRFIDAEPAYLDSTYLDFYCFCIGSFLVSNTQSNVLFKDVINEDTMEFSPLNGSLACDLAKKVLFVISDNDTAEKYLNQVKEKFQLEPDSTVCADDIIEYLIEIYQMEENRISEQLKEQFEMDAAQYGGILSFGQFQTLSMFSAKKLDFRLYPVMMREIIQGTVSKSMSFQTFINGMHDRGLLVPFNFDRVNYNPEFHLEDSFGFLRQELAFHMPEITNLLEKARKDDDTLCKQICAAKAKLEQAIETKKIGFFTEVAQREFYELLLSVSIEYTDEY